MSKGNGDKIPKQGYILIGLYCMYYATIHSFYPNMSKFLQQNYGFNNAEAGHISSVPYLLASVMVPLFGQLLAIVGTSYYLWFSTASMSLVCTAHILFFLFFEDLGADGKLLTPHLILIPVVCISLGHTFLSTLQTPIINQYVS